MGEGWVFIFLLVGVASNIIPVQHRDELEIDIENEYNIATEVLENDEFEIFRGFGYSNSLADIGVPVVYGNNIEINTNENRKSDSNEISRFKDPNKDSEKKKVQKEDKIIKTDENTLIETYEENEEEKNNGLHNDDDERNEISDEDLSYTEEKNSRKESLEIFREEKDI